MTSVIKNQFSFVPWRSTMEAIFLVRKLMERYKEQKDMDMMFIDLEKAYDKIPRKLWWALEKHKVHALEVDHGSHFLGTKTYGEIQGAK
jgi:hypothetical protein